MLRSITTTAQAASLTRSLRDALLRQRGQAPSRDPWDPSLDRVLRSLLGKLLPWDPGPLEGLLPPIPRGSLPTVAPPASGQPWLWKGVRAFVSCTQGPKLGTRGGLSVTHPCLPGSWAERPLASAGDTCRTMQMAASRGEIFVCIHPLFIKISRLFFFSLRSWAEELLCHILLFMPPQQLLTFQTGRAEQQWPLCKELTLPAVPAIRPRHPAGPVPGAHRAATCDKGHSGTRAIRRPLPPQDHRRGCSSAEPVGSNRKPVDGKNNQKFVSVFGSQVQSRSPSLGSVGVWLWMFHGIRGTIFSLPRRNYSARQKKQKALVVLIHKEKIFLLFSTIPAGNCRAICQRGTENETRYSLSSVSWAPDNSFTALKSGSRFMLHNMAWNKEIDPHLP